MFDVAFSVHSSYYSVSGYIVRDFKFAVRLSLAVLTGIRRKGMAVVEKKKLVSLPGIEALSCSSSFLLWPLPW
jgi:hypothetical protein